jgi:DNA repair protein SbcD/Mre11
VRLAHLADLHLGYRQYHRQTAAGINQREADVAQAFRAAIDDVIAARPDVVVVAGDLFHAVRPTNQAIVFCFRQFQRLRAALPGVPVVLVAGNHDTPRATETGSILRLFSELGFSVVADQADRLAFPELDLSILAVPHSALTAPDRFRMRPDGPGRYQVLVVHGEVEGLFPLDRWWAEPGGAVLDPVELAEGDWSYVALGHYHVQKQVGERRWYAGALDYVTPNPWGELIEERKSKVKGKGWLLVDLDSGRVESHPVKAPRAFLDLKPIEARDVPASELDQEIAARLGSVRGGIADKVVRLVVQDVPRHVVRELDHAAIRAAKVSALHLHLDFRRPEAHRTVGVGAPGPRQTLVDVLRSYLANRPLPERVDRERFVREGVALLEAATADVEGTA